MRNLYRLVLDTNIIVSSWFGNLNSPNREIMMLWENGKISVLFSDDMLYEYVEKLSEKGWSEKELAQFVQIIKHIGTYIEIEFFHLRSYPEDQDDIAFVLCAENGKADYLISYDDHLLSLDGVYAFQICRPLDFLFEFRRLVET